MNVGDLIERLTRFQQRAPMGSQTPVFLKRENRKGRGNLFDIEVEYKTPLGRAGARIEITETDL
jgi:hypothetical protein